MLDRSLKEDKKEDAIIADIMSTRSQGHRTKRSIRVDQRCRNHLLRVGRAPISDNQGSEEDL